MAKTRNGAKSGPCSARITASTNDATTMKTWAISHTRTFSQNPRNTSGNEALMSSHEKNCRRTAGQYSERPIRNATRANTATVVAALAPNASHRWRAARARRVVTQ